jgi:hypothetical protein
LSDWSGTNLLEGNLAVAAGRHSKRNANAGKDIVSLSRF